MKLNGDSRFGEERNKKIF